MPHAPAAGPRGLPAPRRCDAGSASSVFLLCSCRARQLLARRRVLPQRRRAGLPSRSVPPALCSAALAWDGLQGACCCSWAPCSLPCARLCHRALSTACVLEVLRGSLPTDPLLAWAAWGLPASGTCCSPVATSPWAWRGLLCPDLLPASARGWCLTAPSVLGSRPSVPSCRGVLAALPAPGPC